MTKRYLSFFILSAFIFSIPRIYALKPTLSLDKTDTQDRRNSEKNTDLRNNTEEINPIEKKDLDAGEAWLHFLAEIPTYRDFPCVKEVVKKSSHVLVLNSEANSKDLNVKKSLVVEDSVQNRPSHCNKVEHLERKE